MEGQAILQPVAAMMSLTFVVWLYLYVRRLGYVAINKIPADQFASPELINGRLPEPVNRPSNNFKNLFELPVLFYALAALLLASGQVDATYLNLAWGFVALRILHSLIHCTVNIVPIRFAVYLLSSLVLWTMVARFLAAAFT